MNKSIKNILKYFGFPKLYQSFKKVTRAIIERNELVHLFFSKIYFNIKNYFQWNINRVPFFIAKNLNKDSIVIDCGANVGDIVKPLLKYEPEVYCFEPNPVAFKKLSENLGTLASLHLFNKAVGLDNKSAHLYLHRESSHNELLFSVSSSLLANKPNVSIDKYYEVEVINFINFLYSIEKCIAILKIDIEGAEVELLNAIFDAGLHSKIHYIFVETHENTIPELLEPTRQLKTRTQALNLKNVYFNWA